TASMGPETTHCSGALQAAIEMVGEMMSASSSRDSATASIAPGGQPCINRPRMAVTAIASSSDRTPEMHAATYSPMLCPTMACGPTPCAIHHWASAYSNEKSAGCVMLVRPSCSAAAAEFSAPG